MLSSVRGLKIKFAFGGAHDEFLFALIEFQVQLLFQGAMFDGDTLSLVLNLTAWQDMDFSADYIFTRHILVEIIALILFLLLRVDLSLVVVGILVLGELLVIIRMEEIA